jgi:acetylornithine aminotransferase
MPGFIRVPYNDIAAIRHLAGTRDDIAAVLVEPIQGEAGIIVPEQSYLAEIRQLCTEQAWLLALDEVQSGMGRTGTFFAYQASGIGPDIVTLAKGLANGVPIGACLARSAVAELFTPGSHGSTFGGNALACAASLATLNVLQSQALWHHAAIQGKKLFTGLQERLKSCSSVKAVRGQGLMIGIELTAPHRELLTLGLEHRLLFNLTRNDTVIRLLPALIIDDEQVEFMVDILSKIIQ